MWSRAPPQLALLESGWFWLMWPPPSRCQRGPWSPGLARAVPSACCLLVFRLSGAHLACVHLGASEQ